MDGAKRAAYRLASITVPVAGEADPDANMGHCVNCGEWDILTQKDMCSDPDCRRLRTQRALDQGAGMVIDGNTYIVTERMRDAPPASLPARKAANNTERQRELSKVSQMTQRDAKKMRRGRELSRDQMRQIEENMTTESLVPQCAKCSDCPRPGDTLCIKHRLEHNALQHKLDPPKYRRNESTSTELPSRKRKRQAR